MLDVFANKKTGGYQHLPAGFVGAPIVKPALALLLRPDGSVVLHNEADDEANEVRKDIDTNYKHELSQSTKKRESSMGTGMMGSMMERDDGRRRHGRGSAMEARAGNGSRDRFIAGEKPRQCLAKTRRFGTTPTTTWGFFVAPLT